jgi:hypothetical protein
MKMTEKPVMRREMAVSRRAKNTRWIQVYATKDAISELLSFGEIVHVQGDMYNLTVDARYDYNEVLAWVEGYGKESE